MLQQRILYVLVLMAFCLCLTGCLPQTNGNRLPIYGEKRVVEREVNGQTVQDTVYHTIAHFEFVDQDSAKVTPDTFEGKVYVADFFFTSCPTICPVMKREMLRVYGAYEQNDEVMILSHSIDPDHDTVAVLRNYAERLGAKSSKWRFVTGDKDAIYEHAFSSYKVEASESPLAPGGFLHSGAFLLIDKEARIRGVYDGTEPDQVNDLIADIPKLLKEYE